MEDYYDVIKVSTLDGGETYEFSGIAREMKLSNFKHVVAMKIQRARGHHVSASDVELAVFGDTMSEGTRTLASYGIDNDMTITRIDVIPEPTARPNDSPPAFQEAFAPPPYPGAGDGANPIGPVLKNIFFQENHRTYTLNEVPASSTVEDVLSRLGSEKKLDEDKMFLIYNGKQLARGKGLTLMDFGVGENNTIIIVERFPGGCTTTTI